VYIKLLFLLFFLINLSFQSFSLDFNKIYQARIEKEKNDTNKIKIYSDWHNELLASNPSEALVLLMKMDKIVQKTNYNYHKIIYAYVVNYLYLADYKKTLNYSFRLIDYCNKLEGSVKIDYLGRAYERIAGVYSELGNIKLAIDYQKKAINFYYQLINNSEEDEKYYYSSKINLANFLNTNKEVEKALKLYTEIEKKLLKIKAFEYLSYVYNGMASCYRNLNNQQLELKFYEKSKQTVLQHTPEDISSLAVANNNIASVQERLGNRISAIINYSEALEVFKKIQDRRSICQVYFNLAMVYRNVNQLKESNDYMLSYLQLKDSIFDEDTKQTIHEMSIKYESEKKEQQNKLLANENEKKQLTIYFAIAGIFLILIILLVIFRNSQIKSKINKELAEKNGIIEEQKALVEEQHKEITDSIKYAERIQGAILPPDQKWQQILPNSFVLNKPKDILSGDFYWIAETEKHIFVAAADCTGHGVPGALISIVNFNLLNKAVLERGLELPSDILDAVNQWLTESLNQTIESSSIKDGMDIALISINKLNGDVLFSGANNPLYLFSQNEMVEYKADKHPVGAFIDENIQHFTTKEIPTKFGDTIYLFSDGFADQFGGPNGKKYKYKQLKEKLFEVKDMPLFKQKELLNKEFKSWKGTYEQTDDVLIIGITIT
jgi:serine phosphatase RsbU (regulator of sigma subunit)